MYKYIEMAQPMPLIVLHSRSLDESEKKNFHKFFNNVIHIDKYTAHKKITDFDAQNTAVFIDLRTTIGRDYVAINQKLYENSPTPVVYVKSSGDECEGLKYKYETKRIRDGEYTDKLSFLNNLYQNVVHPVVGKKKKLLKKLLTCLCSGVAN